ncbi:MAG: hypothetical protein EOM06_03215 [Sphingobacteriia bacterium]|nr:hypothetical protein [Sphingobacteriia bacterium]
MEPLSPGATVPFSNTRFRIKKLLGKGKSAFSWLCENGIEKVVLKQIHDEPSSFYAFTDKFKTELAAYAFLFKMQIPIPEMLGYDEGKKWIFKEYIHGRNASQLIAAGKITDNHFQQLVFMSQRAKEFGFNLDYFPTNFVVCCKRLYYVDYEINSYSEEWNLQNWGLYYWVNQQGMKKFIETGDASAINENVEKGIPYKADYAQKVDALLQNFTHLEL